MNVRPDLPGAYHTNDEDAEHDQFGVVKVLSTEHLIDLLKDGQHDFFVPIVAGVKQKLVISMGSDGAMSVFELASEQHDRFAPELLFATYIDRLARTGRLFYSAASPR
ncbi:MAG: hypothetical protein WAO76_17725 [Georgfuchsia sp.]